MRMRVVLMLCMAIMGARGEQEAVVENQDYTVSCYACGLDEFSPEFDQMGSYCDATKYDDCAASFKMYNHTCDIMDRWSDKTPFVRKCPRGTKSCFFAEGAYGGQQPLFRGCAETQFAHDLGCRRELQAVKVEAGRRSVDVEVHLCYCNHDNCNMHALSKASALVVGHIGVLVLMAFVI